MALLAVTVAAVAEAMQVLPLAGEPLPTPSFCSPPAKGSVPPYPYPSQTNAPWPDGGFPPIPWAAASSAGAGWSVQEATSAMFLANSSGPMNSLYMRNASALGLVGIGWQQQDQLPTDPASFYNPALSGQLEAHQSAAAAALKKLKPELKVMVSADMDCTAAFWAVSKAAMLNASLSSALFLHWPNGSIFYDTWYQSTLAHSINLPSQPPQSIK